MDNGLLLSCSYDKKVIVWIYQRGKVFETYLKNDELRCMDFVLEAGTLLIGTNSPTILS